jgi:uncharacterized protein YjbI with pentapeptide repeats
MANQEHVGILKEGTDMWNKWRKGNPDIKPDLSGADLRGIFYGEGINFNGANLEDSNLSGVFMPHAEFYFAKLNRANLQNAFLPKADFSGAYLQEADLSSANLSDAKLGAATLISARLEHANLNRAYLHLANLSYAILFRTELMYADLTKAVLKEAVLEGANLRSAVLKDADLFRANLTFANLEKADLSSANITEANFSNAILLREVEPLKKNDQLIENIKRHVVQVEVLILVVVLFQAFLSLQQPLQSLITADLLFLFPFVFLAFIPMFIRVTNPESSLRSRLSYGMSGAGLGATIGGGITGAISGGLGAPAGALIGAPIGFLIGAVAGPYIDGVNKKVLTQGEAREFLIKMQKQHPDLTLEKIVEATAIPYLRNKCAVYMFHVDGVIKCTKDDLYKWLESGCWRKDASDDT